MKSARGPGSLLPSQHSNMNPPTNDPHPHQATSTAATGAIPQHYAVGLAVLVVSVGIRQMSIPTLPAAIGAMVILMTLSSQQYSDAATPCGQSSGDDRRRSDPVTSSTMSRSRARRLHDSHQLQRSTAHPQMQRGHQIRGDGDCRLDADDVNETDQSAQLKPEPMYPAASALDVATMRTPPQPLPLGTTTTAIDHPAAAANIRGAITPIAEHAASASVGVDDGPASTQQEHVSSTPSVGDNINATSQITTEAPSPPADTQTTDPTPTTPDVLMFVVHGMGRQSWLGQNVANVRAALAALQDDPRLARNIRRVHVVPVEYHSKLHARTGERVDAIKLSSCAALRTVINDFAVDPLYYFSASNGKYVRDEVTRQLNSLYASFLQSHPTFRGEVTILAHSMGGLVMWDLLNTRPNDVPGVPPADTRLTLPIHRVFCMGSPISNAIVLRGHDPKLYAPRAPFLNVYHPHDPIAYRFEPIWDPRWQHVPPVALGAYEPPQTAGGVAYYRRASWAMVNGNGEPLHRRLLGSIVAQMPVVSMPAMPQLPPLPQLPTMPQLPPMPQLPALPTVVTNGVRSLVATVSMMAAGGGAQRPQLPVRRGQARITGSAQNGEEGATCSSDSCDDGYISDNEEGGVVQGDGDADLVSLDPRVASVSASVESKPESPPAKLKQRRAEVVTPIERVDSASDHDIGSSAVDAGAVSSSSAKVSDLSGSDIDDGSDSPSTPSQAENPPPRKRRKVRKRQTSTLKASAKPKSKPADYAPSESDHADVAPQSPDILTTTAATLWAMFMGGDHSASSTSTSAPPTNPASGAATPTAAAAPADDASADTAPVPDSRKRKRTRSPDPIRDLDFAHPQRAPPRRRRAPTSEGDAAVSAFTEFMVASTATPDGVERKRHARSRMSPARTPTLDESTVSETKPMIDQGASLPDSVVTASSTADPLAPPTPASLSPTTPTTTSDPALSSLPFTHRLDFELPVAKPSLARSRIRHVDVAQEYLSGLRAHFEYWTSKDAMWFVLLSLNGMGPAARTMPRLKRDGDGAGEHEEDWGVMVEEEVDLDGAEWIRIEREEVIKACGNGERVQC